MTADSTELKEKDVSAQFSQRKQNAAVLAGKYTTTKRVTEIFFIITFFVLLATNIARLYSFLTMQTLWIYVSSGIASMILADVFSGLLHWGADTWGTLDTPFVGQSFIRSFREHHVDPFRITHHDFIEANGDNCMTTIPVLAALLFAPIHADSNENLFVVTFMASICVWISGTNQIHKWAHMHKPPKYVSILQECNIILPRKNHQTHHHTPFDRYYCITNGWLNPVLGSFGFWKRTENIISMLTGAVPRQDDAKWTVQ